MGYSQLGLWKMCVSYPLEHLQLHITQCEHSQLHVKCVQLSVRCITNLEGIADSEQPCKHSCFVINGQDSKHPSQPQQGKENDSGLQGGPEEE